MLFRPGSILAAVSHGYGLMRKAVNPVVPECIIVFHKASHNYSSVPLSTWDALANQADYEIAARLYKHSGRELQNITWDVRGG